MKKLPKYFIIKKDRENPLWNDYLAWLNKTYRNPAGQEPWVGTEQFYGYTDAPYSESGTSCGNTAASFGNNPTLITLEYWNECVNEFQLPEFWYVVVNKDNQIPLSKWRFGKVDIRLSVGQIVGWCRTVWSDFKGSKEHDNKISDTDFGQEITFEQFKKYVLKPDSMEKKLIGYKLNGKATADEVAALLNCSEAVYSDGRFFKEEHLGSLTIERAQKLGILDLWFEPVYEEESFKAGDYVVVENSDNLQAGCRECPEGVWKITSSNHQSGLAKEDTGFNVKTTSGIWRISDKGVRKATPEEIAKAKYPDITIKGYKVEFEDNYVKFGCQIYPKEFVLKLSECLEKNDFDMEIRSEIDAIAKYFISLD